VHGKPVPVELDPQVKALWVVWVWVWVQVMDRFAGKWSSNIMLYSYFIMNKTTTLHQRRQQIIIRGYNKAYSDPIS
jgi:hypothetical protein